MDGAPAPVEVDPAVARHVLARTPLNEVRRNFRPGRGGRGEGQLRLALLELWLGGAGASVPGSSGWLLGVLHEALEMVAPNTGSLPREGPRGVGFRVSGVGRFQDFTISRCLDGAIVEMLAKALPIRNIPFSNPVSGPFIHPGDPVYVVL